MTNILWTRTAKNCGLGFHFGAIKGMAYYRELERKMTLQEHLERKRAPKVTVKVIKKNGKKDKK